VAVLGVERAHEVDERRDVVERGRPQRVGHGSREAASIVAA
jgi:hypothetical protein